MRACVSNVQDEEEKEEGEEEQTTDKTREMTRPDERIKLKRDTGHLARRESSAGDDIDLEMPNPETRPTIALSVWSTLT